MNKLNKMKSHSSKVLRKAGRTTARKGRKKEERKEIKEGKDEKPVLEEYIPL